MTAAPAPCPHLGAHVVAHLGSHEPLPWQPVPAPAGTDDLDGADTFAARTGHLTLGRCRSCGVQVFSAQVRGGPDERRIGYPPVFAGRPDSADLPGFLDRGVPTWTSPWTPITETRDSPRPDDAAGPDISADNSGSTSGDVETAAARLRDVLSSRGIDLGPNAEQIASEAVLAVLQTPSLPRP